MERTEFRELIKRGFGWPLVNVELQDQHIDDAIFRAIQKYTRFAVGNATQEHFMTLMLSGGQKFYTLPEGVTEVVSVDVQGNEYGGINTLFTMENYLYTQGAMNFLNMADSGFSLVSYHIAMGFLETMRRYSPSKYTFKYHKESNVLEVNPTPEPGYLTITQQTSAGTYETVEVNSPGFVLLKSFMVEGASEPGFTWETYYSRMFERDWMIEYVTALCKITLGRIRGKMENAANTVGNVGLTLDGSKLVDEGLAEKEKLETALQETEAYMGLGIIIG